MTKKCVIPKHTYTDVRIALSPNIVDVSVSPSVCLSVRPSLSDILMHINNNII